MKGRVIFNIITNDKKRDITQESRFYKVTLIDKSHNFYHVGQLLFTGG